MTTTMPQAIVYKKKEFNRPTATVQPTQSSSSGSNDFWFWLWLMQNNTHYNTYNTTPYASHYSATDSSIGHEKHHDKHHKVEEYQETTEYKTETKPDTSSLGDGKTTSDKSVTHSSIHYHHGPRMGEMAIGGMTTVGVLYTQ